MILRDWVVVVVVVVVGVYCLRLFCGEGVDK